MHLFFCSRPQFSSETLSLLFVAQLFAFRLFVHPPRIVVLFLVT